MIEELRSLLTDIDPQLPAYFLVKGAKAVPIPKSKEEFEKLVENGYQPLVEGVVYEELSQETIVALHDATRRFGGRILVFWPHPVVLLLSHEAKLKGSRLQRALGSEKEVVQPSSPKEGSAEDAQVAKRRSRR
jgi:hypothetical protein